MRSRVESRRRTRRVSGVSSDVASARGSRRVTTMPVGRVSTRSAPALLSGRGRRLRRNSATAVRSVVIQTAIEPNSRAARRGTGRPQRPAPRRASCERVRSVRGWSAGTPTGMRFGGHERPASGSFRSPERVLSVMEALVRVEGVEHVMGELAAVADLPGSDVGVGDCDSVAYDGAAIRMQRSLFAWRIPRGISVVGAA